MQSSPPDSFVPTDRYLVASPEGVRQWLCTSTDSCERALMLHILSRACGCKVDVKALSSAIGAETKELSKALFALNRAQSVCVQMRPQSVETCSIWSLLDASLKAMAMRSNANGIALADPQGLCIASVNTTDIEAQHLAAALHPGSSTKPIEQVSLFVDGGSLPFSLSSLDPIPSNDPGWVALAHCLIAFSRLAPRCPTLFPSAEHT